MAKKAKEEKEEYEFKEPEFNVREFIEKEIVDSKATFVTMGYALVFVFVSYLILISTHDSVLAFLAGLIGMFTFKYILPKVGIETKGFEKKNWLGLVSAYFFTWLAVFVLVCNPPISDFIEPTIGSIEVYAGTVQLNDTKNITAVFGNSSLTVGKEIKFIAKIVDNYQLKSAEYAIIYPNNNTIAKDGFMESEGNNIYAFIYNFTTPVFTSPYTSHYTVQITAKDTYGHTSVREMKLIVYP
jgi:hypothetical protein